MVVAASYLWNTRCTGYLVRASFCQRRRGWGSDEENPRCGRYAK
ncbi:hypothetical protein HMPREF1248_0084 [Coriobacteriaceae bacterium BV3Ac1]|nr:hypothetical protein HMPREF1248_0084 [Coriobacteriaceae bacterium BV3Ac1]